MYHLRLKGTHYEIGVKRGKIFQKCHVTFPLNMDGFQLKHGIESEKILRSYFPEVCDEIKGITDTLNIDYVKFTSWLLAMGCCMYNLDSNIPEVRGCTAFVINYDNKTLYGRNNDLPPFLKKGSKSEIYSLKNGCKFNITTSSFINGEEGINEYGLVVAMTFASTKLEDIRPGFNSVFIVRYLLEKAKTVEEARMLLEKLPVSSNSNILLADKSGLMIIVECSPKEKNIRKPLVLENGIKVICTVNSFTSEYMKKYEWDKENTYNSEERYNTVVNAIKKFDKENDIEYLMNLLKGKYGFICQYEKKLYFETIWSSIFNLNTKEVYRAEGDPRKYKFIEDNRLRGKNE